MRTKQVRDSIIQDCLQIHQRTGIWMFMVLQIKHWRWMGQTENHLVSSIVMALDIKTHIKQQTLTLEPEVAKTDKRMMIQTLVTVSKVHHLHHKEQTTKWVQLWRYRSRKRTIKSNIGTQLPMNGKIMIDLIWWRPFTNQIKTTNMITCMTMLILRTSTSRRSLVQRQDLWCSIITIQTVLALTLVNILDQWDLNMEVSTHNSKT